MNTSSSTIATPAGPLTIVVTAAGAVVAAGFGAEMSTLANRPGRLRTDLGEVTRAVQSYLDGDLAAIDEIPVAQPGRGEFTSAAWQALRDSKPGEPLTYTDLARRAGRPPAVRAAANACARNAVALFVPCHRVVRTDGGLGGYRWGTPVKRWLLDHEARRPA